MILPDRDDLRFSTELSNASKDLRKGQRTKAALHGALCRCADKSDIIQLTVADICKEAKVAHGTFYIYFSDLADLLADVALLFIAFLQRRMRKASQSTAADPINAATAIYVRLFEQNPGLMKYLISHLGPNPLAQAAFQKLNREWLDAVVAATERRLARDGDMIDHDELMRRAYALGGMTDQYLVNLFLAKDPNMQSFSKDKEAVIKTLSLLWAKGLQP